MILIVGATGQVGSDICRRLASKGIPTRALVRSTAEHGKVEGLRALDVAIVEGDLRNAASLATACQGVTEVVCTVSSMPFAYEAGLNDIATTDLDGVIRLVDAAKAAGVRQFVYLSFSANIDSDFPLRNAKRTVEAYVKLSGLAHTILRPSFFMEVWLSPAVGFDPAHGTATVYGSGTRPISWISVADVAEFAVQSLDNPAARNAILELGGPAAVSPDDVVPLFERAYGHSIQVQKVPHDTLRAQTEAATDPMQKSFCALMQAYADGDAIEMGAILQQFPIRLTSVEEHAVAASGLVAVRS
jgi:uncharacterized protein YbjT (DUF2867 family)